MRIVVGIISGFLLGLGIALLLFSYAKIALGTNAFTVVTLVGVAAGLLLGILATVARRSPRPVEEPPAPA
ncbi:MAG: hypothetical protein V7636_2109 [Actinomycetota bacterium]